MWRIHPFVATWCHFSSRPFDLLPMICTFPLLFFCYYFSVAEPAIPALDSTRLPMHERFTGNEACVIKCCVIISHWYQPLLFTIHFPAAISKLHMVTANANTASETYSGFIVKESREMLRQIEIEKHLQNSNLGMKSDLCWNYYSLLLLLCLSYMTLFGCTVNRYPSCSPVVSQSSCSRSVYSGIKLWLAITMVTRAKLPKLTIDWNLKDYSYKNWMN